MTTSLVRVNKTKKEQVYTHNGEPRMFAKFHGDAAPTYTAGTAFVVAQGNEILYDVPKNQVLSVNIIRMRGKTGGWTVQIVASLAKDSEKRFTQREYVNQGESTEEYEVKGEPRVKKTLHCKATPTFTAGCDLTLVRDDGTIFEVPKHRILTVKIITMRSSGGWTVEVTATRE